MRLVNFEKITVEFKCAECGDKSVVTLGDILKVGNPYCTECDSEFEVSGSTAAINIPER